MTSDTPADDFAVDRMSHLLSGAGRRFDRTLRRLGRLETRLLEDQLPAVDRPVYVTGLARSGSTMLLEMLNWQSGVVTHRYRDYPMLQIPVLWNRFLDYASPRAAEPRERAHRDGIVVTRESPEAFEEMLWMSFFPGLHDSAQSNVLGSETRAPEFERFYRDHVRKLLMLRGGNRYVSKGNYNVTRLEYLLSMFPDARFVVPVRNPEWHVASLMKQHHLFTAGQRRHPRATAHLERSGHFEFGLHRRPINTGDAAAVGRVLACWREGRELEGWARYWAMVYDHVLERLAASPTLAAATLLMPYEALCRRPGPALEVLYHHCEFPSDPELLERGRERVHFPDYYQPELSEQEKALIARLTGDTARRLQEWAAATAPALLGGRGDAAGMRIA